MYPLCMHNEETVYDITGEKLGTVVREGNDWIAYSLSDVEVARGTYLLAVWTLQGRA